MELALKIILLAIGFFAALYLVTKVSDKLQDKNKDNTKEDN